MKIDENIQAMHNRVPSIQLSTTHPLERCEEWRKWKALGYRVLDKDGITVYYELEGIRRIVLEFFQDLDADVFLFGSQATGRIGKYSDYDIGYDADKKISSMALSDLRERLEELPIPGQVDLVDFKRTPDEFTEIAIKGGVVVWKQKAKNSRFTLSE